MANTYTQIYIQIIFRIERKAKLDSNRTSRRVTQFITGTVANRGQKLFAVFAEPDHLHLLVSICPNILISD